MQHGGSVFFTYNCYNIVEIDTTARALDNL